MKKGAEQTAFEELIHAHNKFEMTFADYRDKVLAYNDVVEQKHLALAASISSFESFHVIQEELHLGFKKCADNFARFDSGADNVSALGGRICIGCDLTDCQVQALCSAQLERHFETFVSTNTCTPAPYTVDKICNPLPSPATVVVAEEMRKVQEMQTPVILGSHGT